MRRNPSRAFLQRHGLEQSCWGFVNERARFSSTLQASLNARFCALPPPAFEPTPGHRKSHSEADNRLVPSRKEMCQVAQCTFLLTGKPLGVLAGAPR